MPDRHIKLKLIPAAKVNPKTITVMDGTGGNTVLFRGEGGRTDPTWDCGICGAPIMVGIQPGQITGTVLRCGRCRAYNVSD